MSNAAPCQNTHAIMSPNPRPTPTHQQRAPSRLKFLGNEPPVRNRLHLAVSDIVPVCAESSAVALGEALHHRALLLRRSALEDLLEKGIHIPGFLVFGHVVFAHLLPVLGPLLAAGRVRRSLCCDRSGGRGRSRGGSSSRGRSRRRLSIRRRGGRRGTNVHGTNLLLGPGPPPVARNGLLQLQLDLAWGSGPGGGRGINGAGQNERRRRLAVARLDIGRLLSGKRADPDL